MTVQWCHLFCICDVLPTLCPRDCHLQTTKWLLWFQTSHTHWKAGQGERGIYSEAPSFYLIRKAFLKDFPLRPAGQHRGTCLLQDPSPTNVLLINHN